MIDQKHRSIYFRLLVLASELQNPVQKLDRCLKKLGEEITQTDGCHEILAEITVSLSSSSLVCKKLMEWSEAYLLGDVIYSANIKFQADLVTKILSSSAGVSGVIISNIEDLRRAKINLSLFGLMLYELLTIVLEFSLSENLLLHSSHKQDEVIICISGIKPSTYQSMAEGLSAGQGPNPQSQVADRFRLCYDILHFYGGNLWSESCEKSGGKLYFSIPVIKNI